MPRVTWQSSIGSLEKLFRNPIESLCRIELQKVGAVPLPKGSSSLLFNNPMATVKCRVIWTRKSTLFEQLLHGLHSKANEVDGIGCTKSYTNIDIVQKWF